MRGALQLAANGHTPNGIIPAYAGSTASPSTGIAGTGDHPRVCGEHTPHDHVASVQPGSSPRMRGAHGGGGASLIAQRIIPAYAGSTRG